MIFYSATTLPPYYPPLLWGATLLGGYCTLTCDYVAGHEYDSRTQHLCGCAI